MRYCTNCGAELGVGRFCTNCGARIDAPPPPHVPPPPAPPPPAPPPPAPPSAAPPPPTKERPLFAPTPPPRVPAATPPAAVVPTAHRGQRSGFSPWWIVVLVLALIGSAALGTWLANWGSDDDGRDAGSESPGATSPAGTTQPTQDPGLDDLAPTTTVSGPSPLPSGLDINNNPVTYPASNMLDDDPESAYRLPGDASGTVITFELAGVSTISQVGLINGYTKVDTSGASTVDWYPLNRRIVRVEWSFDDGTTVEQPLDPEVRELQLIEVDDIETSTVQLTILEVSPPGTGPGARDATAISDVLLLGS